MENTREYFKQLKKEKGIENAYRIFRGICKFKNYSLNFNQWRKTSLITYDKETEQELLSDERFVNSCCCANQIITRLIGGVSVNG